MSPPHLRLIESAAAPAMGAFRPSGRQMAAFRPAPLSPATRRRPLGQILLDMGAVTPENLLRAIALRDRQDIRLGDILLSRGWVREADLTAALCLQWQVQAVDPVRMPPDPRLADRLGTAFCLRHGVIPWRRSGGAMVILTSRPDDFDRLRGELPKGIGPVMMALAAPSDIERVLIAQNAAPLARRAETRVAAGESCRGQDHPRARVIGAAVLGGLLAGLATLPGATVALLTLWAILTLIATMSVKAAAGLAAMRAARTAPPQPPLPRRLPVVSVMVPLFREGDIVPRLVERLGRIDYPKELLDILLVVEDDDHATHAALARHKLPRWMRMVRVPDGPVRTKPRALNFALDFCRGSIIGVWDAEDEPDPGQIIEVVRRFASAPEDVACLQGQLDFYNARHNWLTRCFTIDYAAWFRVVLPGLARLGLVVPLGGTTLFFRRAIIEKLGGWDAHNVTEDADLGLRLARHGYRTELIPTVTREEPNARVLSWLKQRSRWQKGYAVTWASHMRDPAKLWRDLGPKRFWGVQVLFLGSLTQAVLAPVLLSYWLLAFGLPHPLAGLIPTGLMAAVGMLFVASEAVDLTIGLWALRGKRHRHLIPWLPLMHLYGPLASLSSYKALWEWVGAPFYWDKTRHGLVAQAEEPDLAPSILLLTDPVWLPPEAPAPVLSLHGLRRAPAARFRFSALPADAMPDPPPRPAPVLKLVRKPERAPYVPGSTIAKASNRPGIEFQTRFEGF